MKVPLIDLRRDYEQSRQELMAAAERVLSSGSYVLGKEVEEFERAVAAAVGSTAAVGVASGTDALWLALLGLDVAGKKVLTTPFTFFATATSILNAGAEPVFVDIDATTFNIDPNKAADVLEGRSSVHDRLGIEPRDIVAIVPVHLYGLAADMDPLAKLAAPRGLSLVEDAAQAMGSTYGDAVVGSIGDVGCFSFFPTKNLAGFGDGGMITTSDEELEQRIRVLRAHGATVKYHHDVVGTNSRLDALQAALLAVRLQHLDRQLTARREHAAAYAEAFSDIEGIQPPHTPPAFGHTYHQYTIRVANGRRDELTRWLSERGIQTAVYYPLPLHLQVALRDAGYQEGDMPVAEAAAREVLSLPVFPQMTVEERTCVIDAVRDFVAQ